MLGKLLKVVGIQLGFIWPTFRAKLILALYGCPVGQHLQVCGNTHFRPNCKGAITIGCNVKLTARFLTNTAGISNPILLETLDNGFIEIGNDSGLTSTIISARTRVTIGSFVKIGANVRLFDHDFHALDSSLRRNGSTDRKNVKTVEIIVEDDVFIGANSIILKGVRIGQGSIIGAGSVVALRDIPPFSRVAGNPARIVGQVKQGLHVG